MARLRLRNRATVQRPSPNPAGDGAGNFQDGWDDYLGPVSCAIWPRTGRETQQEGQPSSQQQFYIEFRATRLSQLIDSRDRVVENGAAGRTLDVVANGWQPGQEMVRLICQQTPVRSPDAGYTPGAEDEPEPTFPVGP